ncbi:hypothetical protein DL95DRAFT_506310 [Leptodontidium sp. 2 PMI_412]|nr:hypothetical protein DL95DRAFT_506310 [Leptodontidium sp. 2 PMI_412]
MSSTNAIAIQLHFPRLDRKCGDNRWSAEGPQDGKAVDAGAFTSRGSEPSSGDDGDGDGCSSEDELGRSGTRMNVPWDPIDEQRLLAYKKEGKSWKWIFRQFQGRTENSVRQRLSIVRRRGG